MNELRLPDLKIMGESTSNGGRFRNVRITGECVFHGDVDCTKLACTGNATVQGNLRAEELKLTGRCDLGSIDAGIVTGRGELAVSSRLRGEHIKFTGHIEVDGDCEAGALEVGGAFTVNGLASAERLELRMYGPCRAKEIGGGTITVKRSRASTLVHLFSPDSAGDLTADSIEGDEVSLQHTKAGIVRGNRVTIGPGCEIGRVEYAKTLDIHKNAKVGEVIRQA
ncbi:bactofilin [Cohnella sp. GCM10027633]|uniref:bactofilin n=1 Tax=unclassified Cohnella TaxID=2636738 RepID=UPI003630C4B5